MRTVSITAKKKSFGEDSSAALDRYLLFASYKDDLVYNSVVHTVHSLHGEKTNGRKRKKKYLFKNEKVNLLTDKSLEVVCE